MTRRQTEIERRERLEHEYQSLSAPRQRLVQLLSVAYKPIFLGELTECLSALKIRGDDDHPLSATAVSELLQSLMESGLVREDTSTPVGYRPIPRYYCSRAFVECATRRLIREGLFERFAEVVSKLIPMTTDWQGRGIFMTGDALVREVRIGLYRGDLDVVERRLDDARYNEFSDGFTVSAGRIYAAIVSNPLEPYWLEQFPPTIVERAAITILDDSVIQLQSGRAAFDWLQSYRLKRPPADSEGVAAALATQWLLRGDAAAAGELLAPFDSARTTALDGLRHFLLGDGDRALELFRTGLKLHRRSLRKRQCFFDAFEGVWFVVALLGTDDSPQVREAADYIQMVEADRLSSTYRFLGWVAAIQLGETGRLDEPEIAAPDPKGAQPFDLFFQAMALFWIDRDRLRRWDSAVLDRWRLRADACGLSWLAAEMAELIGRLLPNRGDCLEQASAFRQRHAISRTLVDLLQPKAPWERTLHALADVTRLHPAVQANVRRRLAWLVSVDDQSATGYRLEPREQRMGLRGSWGKGTSLSLKRLSERAAELACLTDQDVKMTAHICQDSQSRRLFLEENAWLTLAGHPLVYWADRPDERIELVRGRPELRVGRVDNDRINLQFLPQLIDQQRVAIVRESPARLRVIGISDAHHYLYRLLGERGITVPAGARSTLLSTLGSVSSLVTVHSDVGGGIDSAESITADDRPYIHLFPRSGGLRVEMLVCPFGPPGPYYTPGAGGETVIAEIDGKRVQARRVLTDEKQAAAAVVEACDRLSPDLAADGCWELLGPEACLEFLLQLQSLEDRVVIEWPKGKTLDLVGEAGLEHLHLRITRDNDWFGVDGSLQLDDEPGLEMRRLLALTGHATGRFVQLDDGRFLALTQACRKSLEDLRAFADDRRDVLRLHPLAALGLDEWIGSVGEVSTDTAWDERRRRLGDAQQLDPELPSTLQAELRDYQREGFAWLVRLAHWGVGACLADDMGLGKTLQTLALILTRAPQGPTLIVAPTSVCANWSAEVGRFAPTLTAKLLGAGDRRTMLETLKPFDLVICSYGLLQQAQTAELLATVQWSTIVLDEAQAIKNRHTRRWQGAMALQGGFKVITTGTPIENHLGELWNLFQFINPGLLGSEHHFQECFAGPIERDNDAAARARLKRLVQPFILRRTKSQVLDELPPRTEIVLHVELSEDERRLYESLRQNAMAQLSGDSGPATGKRFQILAELMKLRRACCNPVLVMRDTTIASTKLAVFIDTVTELLDNRHKALVFSQFVDHLRLIGNELDRRRIQYQYLDGQTPASQRRKRIDAFQAGEGDLFLISLKAGGVGLNLTAADYVIHMDPWWSPAAEDQASDRAHRFGQQRPVTVYRLVCKDTIEEKILTLHQHKRDLADSLLEGSEMVGKMSAEDLLRLIGSDQASEIDSRGSV